MEYTTHYNLKKPGANDFAKIAEINENTEAIDTALHGLEAGKVPAAEKGTAGGVAPLDANMLVPLSHLPSQVKERRVVNTIAERNAIADKFSGLQVYVKDASADPGVTSGGADYLWDGAAWIKTGEAESMDVVLSWENVQNKPAAYPPSTHSHIFGPVTVTVPVANWTGSGPWEQTVTVAGVLASDNGLGVYPVDVADDTARKAYEKAYACLAAEAETVNGGMKLICRDGKPETDFTVVVKGVR